MTTETKEKTETDMTPEEAWYIGIAVIEDELAQEDAALAAYYADLAAGEEYVADVAAQEYKRLHNEAQRQDMDQKLKSYKVLLDASINEQKAKLAAASAEAQAGIVAHIADLKAKRDEVRQKLEASWDAQRRSLQNAIDGLKSAAARDVAAAKARFDAQIAELQAKRDEITQELETSRNEKLAEWQQDIDALKAEAAAKDGEVKACMNRQIKASRMIYHPYPHQRPSGEEGLVEFEGHGYSLGALSRGGEATASVRPGAWDGTPFPHSHAVPLCWLALPVGRI